MEKKAYRIGIDVGGTFTKAVLIDDESHEIVGRAAVPTTHADARGVAAGVVAVFRHVLERSGVDPKDVVFLAHSTTQATNALLEGDVAPVGIVGMASELVSTLAQGQSRIAEIELAPGRSLRPGHRFITIETLDERAASAMVEGLRAEGAEVIVATSAFGVDDSSCEETIRGVGNAAGLPVTCAHEISSLYGLATRTRTAVINASILPRMIETAAMTEASVHEAGIDAPLMIMRGDGGVMDMAEMRRRPAMTMLSGPAASVAGALMHLRISDGLYFEVGGTSTNIGVIRNGRPAVRYARVGGHETYVSSLDVRVIGIGGGSMVRVKDSQILDVGPRSAHIAGLPYAAFAAAPHVFAGAEVELFQPRPGDPADYVAIRTRDGGRHALTSTCAANALGYAKPGMHAHGNPEAARAALAPLAAMLGCGIDEAARQILDRAAQKAVPVVEQLVAEYGLDGDQVIIVGEGGGAGALAPFVAERMGLAHTISRDAEIISSIGVALALVRDAVERVIPDPQPEELRALRREAHDAVVRQGASPETVDVTIEIDPHSQRVRAVAVGACGMQTRTQARAVSEAEACAIAAESIPVPADDVRVMAATDRLFVIQAESPALDRHPVRVVDLAGGIRLRRSNATVTRSEARQGLETLKRLWEDHASDNGGHGLGLEIVGLIGAHIFDLAGAATLGQALALTRTEVEGVAPDAPVIFIAPAGKRR